MMEDRSENFPYDPYKLHLSILSEMNERQIILMGHSTPSISELIRGAEKTILVVNSGDEDDFERARREMKIIGLSFDDVIEQLKPPPVFPIEAFERAGETINPFRNKKTVKSLEWKNKLKSLYRVKI